MRTFNSIVRFRRHIINNASRYSHFDFLLLPRELRDRIYRLLLLPPTRKIKPQHVGSLPTAIMNVCHQTNLEAREILFAEAWCKIECTSLRYQKTSPPDWFYAGIQDWNWPVSNFRNLRLEIDMFPTDGPRSIPGFDPTGFLQKVVDLVKKTDHFRKGYLVKMDVRFTVIGNGKGFILLGPSKWPDETAKVIQTAMSNVRDLVHKEHLNILMTTNAEPVELDQALP
jgi:hypothetical protein